MEPRIRLLTPEDEEQFSRIRLRAVREEPMAFGASEDDELRRPAAETAARLAAGDDRFVLGAFDGDTIVGTTGLWRSPAAKTRHRAMLWGVYVAPEYRGRGIARRLVSEALDRAADLEGVELVSLHVNAANESACRLYRSVGFVCYGIERMGLKVDGRYVALACMDIVPAERRA